MSVLIVGSKGNMASRYKTCLEYLNEEYVEYDIGMRHPAKSRYGSILIATPTETHLDLLDHYAKEGKPILVEKPIITYRKDLETLERILFQNEDIYMVNQYYYNNHVSDSDKDTVYNYFKHGTDGLFWDCIQPIAMSNGNVYLAETSPVWTCVINGTPYNLSDMDDYYLSMIMDFVNHRAMCWGPEEIINAHKKVFDYEDSYRNSSKEHVH